MMGRRGEEIYGLHAMLLFMKDDDADDVVLAVPTRPFKYEDFVDVDKTAERLEVPIEMVRKEAGELERRELEGGGLRRDDFVFTDAEASLVLRQKSRLTKYLAAAFDAESKARGYRTYDEFIAHVMCEIIASFGSRPQAALSAMKEANRLLFPTQETEVTKRLSDADRVEILRRIEGNK